MIYLYFCKQTRILLSNHRNLLKEKAVLLVNVVDTKSERNTMSSYLTCCIDKTTISLIIVSNSPIMEGIGHGRKELLTIVKNTLACKLNKHNPTRKEALKLFIIPVIGSKVLYMNYFLKSYSMNIINILSLRYRLVNLCYNNRRKQTICSFSVIISF